MAHFMGGGKSSVALDASGNIDTSKLEEELRHALEFDVRYKQTDNMKKRACKVSGSYDEFKAMVACAHLKTLTSKEVQSLAAPKKGWQKGHVSSAESTASALILQQEQREAEMNQGGTKTEKAGAPPTLEAGGVVFQRPKTAMGLERDLRRLANETQRLAFLKQLGAKRARKVFSKGDSSPDLLELVLGALLPPLPVPVPVPVPLAEPADASEGVEGAEAQQEEQRESEAETWAWLVAIAEFERFSVSVHFVAPAVLARVHAWLTAPTPGLQERAGYEDLRRHYLVK
jgi:hypothetical protein